ncbi:MAG: hypothetical protein HY909_17160 [Deltaproteobacteria bacterium]|nr:hypothetical protein [Deltaproteobacteria bacterium]
MKRWTVSLVLGLAPGLALAQAPPLARTPARTPAPAREGELSSHGGRVWLAFGQGVGGLGVGLGVALAVDARNPGIYVGAGVLGAGLGIATAAVLSRDGVTEGQSVAVGLGTVYGAAAGLFLTFGTGQEFSLQLAGGITAASVAVGTLGGVLVSLRRPDAARVHFAGGVGLWSAFLASSLYLATRGYGTFDTDRRAGATQLLGLTSLGALGGGLLLGTVLAPLVRITPRRMAILNAAILGGGAVCGVYGMVFSLQDATQSKLVAGYGLGAIAGMGIGALTAGFSFFAYDLLSGGLSPRRSEDRRGQGFALLPGGPEGSPGLSLVGSF